MILGQWGSHLEKDKIKSICHTQQKNKQHGLGL